MENNITTAVQGTKSTKERIIWLDILRLFACFLVLLTHSSMPENNMESSIWLALISLLCWPSPDLFIGVSGAVLLPVKEQTKEFLKKRFSKIVIPAVFWSVFMVIWNLYSGRISTDTAIEQFLFIPIKPVIGIYWFIYVICGLYLFAPILSSWMRSAGKQGIEYLLFLWGITQIMPFVNLWKPDLYAVNGSVYFLLYPFCGFIGLMLIGIYVREYMARLSKKGFCMLTIGVLAIYGLAVFLNLRKILPTEFMLDNLSVFSAIMVLYLFWVAKSFLDIHNRVTQFISNVSKYAYGIYLIHIVVIRDFIWKLFEGSLLNPLVKALLIAIIGLITCFIIIRLIAYLPKSKWIIGV